MGGFYQDDVTYEKQPGKKNFVARTRCARADTSRTARKKEKHSFLLLEFRMNHQIESAISFLLLLEFRIR
jgi:hypothetical protein